ncbi:hypothetical protein LHJ74_19330 [Streptomyces sp. N2-109]|uniref:Uncharacterized protein n=1 Tax=Streptomyces gossypii TaxID=2883101 RepID=A0ABT2JVV3_9ACTN|nr:hypothetical protein [Streptomyces gossypii]MCT2592028.1 hypothetical protein [Streptomyces gossypii]
MYESIRTPSVHTTAETDVPRRSRDEELDIRLAGHLTALLTVTDELRALTPDPAFDKAAQQLADQSARLGGGRAPLRAVPSARDARASHLAGLHQRAHTLAGMALVIATAREDDAAAELAAARLEAHAAALGLTESA